MQTTEYIFNIKSNPLFHFR